MESYLANWKQRVNLNIDGNIWVSDEMEVEMGVPQCTILSPPLFIIYTCELVEHLKENCEPILYAHDTNIMIISPISQRAVENASVTM